MIEKVLSSRFNVLYLIPFCLGILTVFSFQPFNFSLINFFILPIFFLLVVYVNKRSRSYYRKKPLEEIYFYWVLFLDLVFI